MSITIKDQKLYRRNLPSPTKLIGWRRRLFVFTFWCAEQMRLMKPEAGGALTSLSLGSYSSCSNLQREKGGGLCVREDPTQTNICLGGTNSC